MAHGAREGNAVFKASVQVETLRVTQLLRDETPRMIPYVMATLTTALGKRGQSAVKKKMPTAFDGVTAFTLSGVRVKAATKSDPVAEVFIADSQEDRGRPAREYLRPGAEGTSKRNQRKHEFLMTRAGYLPPGWVTVPGKGASTLGLIDSYGNIPGSIYKQILSVLAISSVSRQNATAKSVKRGATASARRAKKLGVAAEYFVALAGNRLANNGGTLPPGVWRHLPNRGLAQILKFVRKAAYRPRLDMQKIVQAEVSAGLAEEFNAAFAVVKQRFGARA